jgi:hypothetical protein
MAVSRAMHRQGDVRGRCRCRAGLSRSGKRSHGSGRVIEAEALEAGAKPAGSRATVASRPTRVPLQQPCIAFPTYSWIVKVQLFRHKSCRTRCTPRFRLISLLIFVRFTLDFCLITHRILLAASCRLAILPTPASSGSASIRSESERPSRAGRARRSGRSPIARIGDARVAGLPRQSFAVTASSSSANWRRAASRRVGTCSLGTPSAGAS